MEKETRKAGGRGAEKGKEGREIMLVFLSVCHLLQPGGPPPLGCLGERLRWVSQATPRITRLPLSGSMLSTDNNPEGISDL